MKKVNANNWLKIYGMGISEIIEHVMPVVGSPKRLGSIIR